MAPAIQSGLCRLIIWTPRVEVVRVSNYFTTVGLTILTLLDFNVMTVHRDIMFNLSPPYMQELVNADIAAGPYAYKVLKPIQLVSREKLVFKCRGRQHRY